MTLEDEGHLGQSRAMVVMFGVERRGKMTLWQLNEHLPSFPVRISAASPITPLILPERECPPAREIKNNVELYSTVSSIKGL